MYDFIIIGGGAIGASIARILSKYEAKIALLEKNVDLCTETTKANSAIIHAGYDCEIGSLKAKLNVRGNEMFKKLSEELGFEYKQIGSLVLAFNDDEIQTINQLYERGLKNNVSQMEIIDKDKILKLESKISNKVKKALYAKTAGIVDPFNYTYAMIENAMTNGVEVYTQTEVLDINSIEDGIELITNNDRFNSKYVINCAGLYSDKISNMAGDFDYKLIPTKGVYRLLQKKKVNQINHILFQTPSELGKGVLVAPTYDGNTLLGPTSEELSTVDENTSIEESLEIIDNLTIKTIPDINIKDTINIFTGVRAKPDTGDFMIYPSKRLKGFIHVGGIESPGLASAPAIAEYVLEILKEQSFEYKLKENFIKTRKKIPRIFNLDKLEKEKLKQENPDYDQIICRCEQISLGEIMDALDSNSPPVTIDGVKRRVRAGMGRCQGTYCGKKVKKILADFYNIDLDEVKQEDSGIDIVNRHLK